jgi:uncharacterized protein
MSDPLLMGLKAEEEIGGEMVDNHRQNSGAYGPFYFGTVTQPLYGYYHPPLTAEARRNGIVLCAPLGHEYLNCHRTFRQLAMQLSASGFPVLRFDFSGCGDSGGEFEQMGFAHWVNDIAMAIEEMKGRSGLGTVRLIGLRLGGTLSLMAGAHRSDITHMVLWEPIVDGRTYLKQLHSLTQKALAYLLSEPRPSMPGEQGLEFMGFLYTRPLLEDIQRIDLLHALRELKVHQILTIENEKSAHILPLMQHLKRGGISTEHQYISGPKPWLAKPYQALIPTHILTTITTWISQAVS